MEAPSKTLLKRSKTWKQDEDTSWNPKKVFRASFFPRWPQLDANEEQQVVRLLQEAFTNNYKRRRGGGRKRDTSCKDESNVRNLLVFGFNQVTRLAERGQLQAIFVMRYVEPDILIQHFPWLCMYHDILLFPMQNNNMEKIRAIFQLHSLMVMGLRRLTHPCGVSLQGQYSLEEFMDRLGALAPCFPPSEKYSPPS